MDIQCHGMTKINTNSKVNCLNWLSVVVMHHFSCVCPETETEINRKTCLNRKLISTGQFRMESFFAFAHSLRLDLRLYWPKTNSLSYLNL